MLVDSLLHLFDATQQINQFGIRLAVDGHSAEVADVAAIVAARVERDDTALLPTIA